MERQKLMMLRIVLLAAAGLLIGPAGVGAATIPFTENFDTGVANWTDNAQGALTFHSAGSHDGGAYASASFNYNGFVSPFGGGPVTHRANALSGASGGAFIGNYVAEGVDSLSAWVRHNAPSPLAFYARVASSPGNFPGNIIPYTGAPVLPNTWTQLTFSLSPSNPACVPETATCAANYASVGNLQFGTDAPSSLLDDDVAYTLDIDTVTISGSVPEPSTALLFGVGLLGLAHRGRARR